MIFELAQDFQDAVAAMSSEHPKHRMLSLLEEAIRRDIHFIARHPTTLFQCMWNTCWWYDCPEAVDYYELHVESQEPVPAGSIGLRFHEYLETWRRDVECRNTGYPWMRALRPPPIRLGSGQRAVYEGIGDILSVAVSPDERFIAAGDGEGWIHLWDRFTDERIASLVLPEKYPNRLAFSMDGRTLLARTGSGILAWDFHTLMPITGFRGVAPGRRSVAFSADGRSVVFGCADNSVRAINIADRQLVGRLRGFNPDTCGVAYSPDGPRLYRMQPGQKSLDITVFDVSSGKKLVSLHGHSWVLEFLIYSPDGRHILTGSAQDDQVCLWNAMTGEMVHSLKTGGTTSATFLRDGEHIALGGINMSVSVWNLNKEKRIHVFHGHDHPVECVAAMPGQDLILSGGDHTVRIWCCGANDSQVRLKCASTENASGIVQGVAAILSESANLGGGIAPERGITIRDIETDHEQGAMPFCFDISPDGQNVACGQIDGDIHVVDIETGLHDFYLRGHQSMVTSVAHWANGPYLASTSFDCTTRIWSLIDRTQQLCLSGEQDCTSAVCFSPDGHYLAIGLGNADYQRRVDGLVRVWDLQTGNILASIHAHDVMVEQVVFSPDGRQLASTDRHGTTRIWDTNTWRGIASFNIDSRDSRSALIETNIDKAFQWVFRAEPDVAGYLQPPRRHGPWKAVSDSHETGFVDCKSGQITSWFHEQLNQKTGSPLEPLWVGSKMALLSMSVPMPYCLRLERYSNDATEDAADVASRERNASQDHAVISLSGQIDCSTGVGRSLGSAFDCLLPAVGDNDRPVLTEIAALLESEGAQAAIQQLDSPQLDKASPDYINLRAVCLLRLGRCQEALKLLMSLVIPGQVGDSDVPLAYRANYVTALLLCGNIEGFLRHLPNIPESTHPYIASLRESVSRWSASMTWIQRFLWKALGIVPHCRLTLQVPPGLTGIVAPIVREGDET